MKILVTGISGFLGRHLTRELLASGDQVCGTYVGTPPEIPGVPVEEVDAENGELLRELVTRWEPEAVVHLAALSHVGSSWGDLPDYHRVNVLGTEVTVRAAAGRHFVFASSAEVYGLVPEEEQPIDENRTAAPASPYALTKAAAELLVLARGGVVARCFNMVGPGQAGTFALPSFARQLALIASGEREPKIRVGNLTSRRDFVHVRDGVRALALLAHGVPPGGGVYNVATGRAWAISEALQALIETSGLTVSIEEDPERYRPVDLPLLQGRARPLEELGWVPELGLEDALGDLWDEQKEQ